MDTKTKPYTVWTVVSLVSLMIAAAPVAARAQRFENAGIRAQGMGGAFVAVADDATATWWNPAGLAHGSYFSSILEWGENHQPDAERDPAGTVVPASRNRIGAFAMVFPALGLSYYHLTVSQIQPLGSTVAVSADRQGGEAAAVRLLTLALSEFGATVGQSLGEHFIVGSTIKVVHGSLGVGLAPGAAASLDAAESLDRGGETHADLDLGAMAAFNALRLGVTVKNVSTPEFGAGDDRLELRRRARAGISVLTEHVVAAADLDLTTSPEVTGDERRIAAGVEVWTGARRLGLRGGVNANTKGTARLSGSGGFSLALRHGFFLDMQRTVGADAARQGWGVGLRASLY